LLSIDSEIGNEPHEAVNHLDERRKPSGETIGTVAGMIAEVASKGTPGVGPAVGLSVATVVKLGESIRVARIGRMAETVEAAIELMDVGLDIFEEQSREYAPRLELLAQILEAAAHTSMQEKIKALSKVLADGFGDSEDAIARARIVAAALADIEAPHIRVLALLKEEPHPRPGIPSEEAAILQISEDEDGPPPPAGWNVGELGERLKQDATIMPAILAVLSGHGVISTGLGPKGMWELVPSYRITPIGALCLDLLKLGGKGQGKN
jgi:hypothetical protein